MKQHISLHFTTKSISLESVKELFEQKLPSLFSDKDLKFVINHCFLDRKLVEEKGWDTSLVEFFESLEQKNEVCYWMSGYTLSDINDRRNDMLKSMVNNEGIVVFIGPIIDGVAEELHIVDNLGLPYFSIR